MSRDLQYARTDRAIVDAVLRLLSKKSIEKISVSDITEEALVNRSTFYQHYPDKFAVLEHLQAQYVAEILEKIRQLQSEPIGDLGQVDRVFGTFFDSHRSVLKLLLSVKTESFDLSAQLKNMLKKALLTESGFLNPLEAEMLAAMGLCFFEWYLEHERDGQSYSTLFFQSCLSIALNTFGLSGKPGARDALLHWIMEQNEASHT